MGTKETLPSKLTFGVALLVLGTILIAGGVNKTTSLNSSFEGEPLIINEFSDHKINETDIPRKVIIPRMSVDLNIKKSEVINGYWQVFDDVAGWGSGSGIPGSPGNQVIFAHAKEGLFLPLRSIKLDDSIYVFTESKWFGYSVREIKEVYPDRVEIINPTDDETLTLYTCSGFADKKRLVIIAKRI